MRGAGTPIAAPSGIGRRCVSVPLLARVAELVLPTLAAVRHDLGRVAVPRVFCDLGLQLGASCGASRPHSVQTSAGTPRVYGPRGEAQDARSPSA
jgi:hypothetical protein